MAKYVILVNWTPQGIANAKDTVSRANAFRELAQKHRSEVELILWTLGRYDIVSVVDSPDDETMAALAMAVSGQGSIRTETLRAFTDDDVTGIIGQLG